MVTRSKYSCFRQQRGAHLDAGLGGEGGEVLAQHLAVGVVLSAGERLIELGLQLQLMRAGAVVEAGRGINGTADRAGALDDVHGHVRMAEQLLDAVAVQRRRRQTDAAGDRQEVVSDDARC